VADAEGNIFVVEDAAGQPSQLFMRMSKGGSLLAGVLDAFAVSVTTGLAGGVPLRVFVEKFVNTRFEPAGMTDDPDLRIVSSIMDYTFRRLAVDYLPLNTRSQLGVLTTEERTQPRPRPDLRQLAGPLFQVTEAVEDPDAPHCMQCGVKMMRAGTCHACPSCGTTYGCE
jgi:ribonucleoside-diphosphate reductase alpha chain